MLDRWFSVLPSNNHGLYTVDAAEIKRDRFCMFLLLIVNFSIVYYPTNWYPEAWLVSVLGAVDRLCIQS